MAGETVATEYYENPILTASGEERLIAWRNALLRDNEGRIAGTLSSGVDITDRRKAEGALQMSARVFEHSIDMLCVAGFDGYFKNLNPSWERTLGWNASELLAKPWIEFVHPDDRAATQEVRSTLANGREVYQFENRYVCKDGSIKWLSWNSFPYPAEGIMFGVARDVTEAKRAGEALRDSEEKYRLLVENAGEAVFVAQDGALRFANPATARLLGRELQDLVGRPFANLVHPDDRDMVVSRHLRRASGEGEIEQGYTFRVIHGDGGVRWVEINAVRIEWEGRPATLNFADDITARRTAEDARRESEERFRRIFEESSMGMVMAGPDFRFTRANAAFCRMLGYSEAELLEKTFADITHPAHVDADIEAVKHVARGETPSYHTEKRYVRKDGVVVWGAVTSTAMRDAEGKVQYFLAMIDDISARKESEAALEESERRYRELANDLPTCVFEAGLDGRVTYANRTGLVWFGYDEGEVVGVKSIAEMVIESERDQARRTFRAAAEEGSVPAGEYTALRSDGTTFPALVSSRAIMRDGKAIGVRGILVDITERVEAARRIERALSGTIHALAVTTEMRDPYTAGHQERVTRLAVAIAGRMGLPADRLEGLRVAGLLHDVGKVSVPAEILSKPTGLSTIEFALVRSHSETGYAILREIEFPWPVATIVLQHHERMDGSGYPSGLRGEEILLEARILAVADSVEAMASHRPYRAALGIEEALAELARGRGTAYDVDAASACLSLFTEDGFRLDV
jgi:PAS domain S-box-containing protein/putative nucleotidyltransferase with HDIG domain